MSNGVLAHFSILSFNHKHCDLQLIGALHIELEMRAVKLMALKEAAGLEELMYISTCNRVEFLVKSDEKGLDHACFLALLSSDLIEVSDLEKSVEVFRGDAAVKHLLKVTASLDSVIIGEREIITQVRKAYEECSSLGLTGDLLRLVMRRTIETAKTVFTETAVFKKPVSVVSLAFHTLRDMAMPRDSRVLMIGAGKTNRSMAKFLAKHGMKQIAIFNRTKANAESLAKEVGGKAYSLDELQEYADGFDVMITCTSASQPIVNQSLLAQLIGGEHTKKVFIDLAVPGDIDPKALGTLAIPHRHIDITELKAIADINLIERYKEIEKCEAIIDQCLLDFHDTLKQREVEKAMSHIPQKVKEIKHTAVNEVYAKELQALDPESRALLERILNYMEKKYISVPMRMAKEVMLSKK